MIENDMNRFSEQGQKFAQQGFTIIERIFTDTELNAITKIIAQADKTNPNFRQSQGLFAIRQFLKEFPGIAQLILNENLRLVFAELLGHDYFIVKSIYFDKPELSNWFVSYHQDLTISLKEKIDKIGFGPWTVKNNQYSVQPPLPFLEGNFTIRIHLDDTNIENGALRVIPGSHLKGIFRPEHIDWSKEFESVCNVPKGGIMLMRPLLLHASGRTTNHQQRRVIHIELSNKELPEPLKWAEQMEWN